MEEYLNFRFAPNTNDDDNNKNSVYNPNVAPSGQAWDRPTETIYANCNTCEARSKYWTRDQMESASHAIYGLWTAAGLGMGLLVCFFLTAVRNGKRYCGGKTRTSATDMAVVNGESGKAPELMIMT